MSGQVAKDGQQELHIVLVSKDPERVYPALTLALGALALGSKVSLYATMSALEIVKKHVGPDQGVAMPGLPPAEKYVRDAIQAGAKVCACAPSREMLKQMGVTEQNVIDGVQLEDVVGFLSNALPAAKNGGVILFV